MPATMLSELVEPYPESVIREAVRSAKPLRERWKRVVGDAAFAHRLPELHATRDEYRAHLESRLRMLEDIRGQAASHPAAGDSPELGELDEAVDDLQQFLGELFPQWDTLEDFYKVAVKTLTISAERLDEIAKKSPPPQSWWDETINPFE